MRPTVISSRNWPRPPKVSPPASGARVDAVNSAISAVRSIQIGSSIQSGPMDSRAAQIAFAAPRPQIPCSSALMLMRSPCALRIASKGAMPAFRSSGEIFMPSRAPAAKSNGQIFIDAMLICSNSAASSSGAGIVDADIVPGRAAEQRVEWLAGRLPDNVPERHVDRRGGADLGAGAAEADIRPCRAGQRLDAASVRADEGGRDPLVDVGVDRGTAEPALAKPDQALVSMDANPDQRRARGEAHRLDLGDLHRSPKHPRQRSALEPKAPSRPWTAETEAVPLNTARARPFRVDPVGVNIAPLGKSAVGTLDGLRLQALRERWHPRSLQPVS